MALFVGCLALLGAGLLLPQRPLLGADGYRAFAARWPWLAAACVATGLDDVFRSVVLKAVFGIFALQLAAFLASRGRELVREAVQPSCPRPDALPIRLAVRGGPAALDLLHRTLAARGYRVWSEGGSELAAVKNRFSPLAGLVFHASLLLLLGGGWVTMAGSFKGDVVLAEGQPFHGTAREYLSRSPARSRNLPPIAFTPERVRLAFADPSRLLDIRCEVRLPAGRVEVIAANRPLRQGGAAVLVMGFGLAPLVAVRRAEGARLTERVCANLEVWAPGCPVDSFRLARPPATVRVRFFPDFVPGPRSRSMRLRNPVLEVRVEPDDPGLPAARGLLAPGAALRFPPYELRLEELRTWARFHVSREPGGPLVLAGFLMLVAGLAGRLFFERRWVSARAGDVDGQPVVRVGGRAEFHGEAFRAALERWLARPGCRVVGTDQGDGAR